MQNEILFIGILIPYFFDRRVPILAVSGAGAVFVDCAGYHCGKY